MPWLQRRLKSEENYFALQNKSFKQVFNILEASPFGAIVQRKPHGSA
jgi:hypothetical protein